MTAIAGITASTISIGRCGYRGKVEERRCRVQIQRALSLRQPASQPAPILPDSYYLGFNYHRQHRSIENGTCLHIMNNSHLRNDAFIAHDDCLLLLLSRFCRQSMAFAFRHIVTSKIPAARRNENTHGQVEKSGKQRRNKGKDEKKLCAKK